MSHDVGEEGDVAERTELLIDALVARVPVSGYDIVKTEVKPYDGQFHAFVLAKIPFDEFNRILKKNKDAMKGEFDGAFEALEKRINEREARAAAQGTTVASPAAAPTELTVGKPVSALQPVGQTPQQANAEIERMIAGEVAH